VQKPVQQRRLAAAAAEWVSVRRVHRARCASDARANLLCAAGGAHEGAVVVACVQTISMQCSDASLSAPYFSLPQWLLTLCEVQLVEVVGAAIIDV
jgi:hypothetical protein